MKRLLIQTMKELILTLILVYIGSKTAYEGVIIALLVMIYLRKG